MCIKLEFANLEELKAFAKQILTSTEQPEKTTAVAPVPPAAPATQPMPITAGYAAPALTATGYTAVQPAPQPATQPMPTATGYTPLQLAQAAMQLRDAGRIAELVPLLERFGVQAVTQLRAEQHAAFAEALVQMGVKL